MKDLTKLSLQNFLDHLAERTPTPGGGGVAGVSGALACALARMVAAYSITKKTEPDARAKVEAAADQLRRADTLLRGLISQDAAVYSHMTEAGKAAKADPSARPDYQRAVLAAVAIPMEMAAVASNALAVMDGLKTMASAYLLSDLGVAAVVADATAHAAQFTVRVNAKEVTDAATQNEILNETESVASHCAKHRASIESFVRGHLQNGPT